MVLWHLEVENQKPADIAPLLGMSANSVSALAYRAREGLRQAYLNMHSGRPGQRRLPRDQRRCSAATSAAPSRAGTPPGSRTTSSTAAVHGRLPRAEPRSTPRSPRLLGPALLGGVAAAYLGGGAAGAGLGAGALVLLGRGKDFVLANAPASAATAAAVGVVGVVGIAVVTRGPSEDPAAAEQSVPGRALPSFAPTPTRTRRRSSDPGSVTSPGQGTPAERGQGTGAGSNPVTGALGISTPTPGAQLLDSAGDQLAEPGQQSVPASGPGAGRNRASRERPGQARVRVRAVAPPERHRNPARSRPRSRPTKPTDNPTRRAHRTDPVEPPGLAPTSASRPGRSPESHGRATVWAKVSGVPQRQAASSCTATASTGDLRRPVIGCQPVGHAATSAPPPLAHPVRLRRQRERAADGDLQGDSARRLHRPVARQQQRERPGVRRPRTALVEPRLIG